MEELVFTFDTPEVWLCPYCGADTNPGVCSRCDEKPTLDEMFGRVAIRGRTLRGRPPCEHPRRFRSKVSGRCLECERKRGAERRKKGSTDHAAQAI